MAVTSDTEVPNYYQFHGKFPCAFNSNQGTKNGCRRIPSRPSIYRPGLGVSSPSQVWQLRVDNFMIMIALIFLSSMKKLRDRSSTETVVTSHRHHIVEK